MTPEQEQRIKAMMRETAKEEVTIEQVRDCLYTYGSELACLRIFAKYNTNGAYPNRNARVGYSENLKTWYFSLENLNLPSKDAHMDKDERLKQARTEAQEAFWLAFSARYPEAATGDFPPDAAFEFNRAIEAATQTWLDLNLPDEDVSH